MLYTANTAGAAAGTLLAAFVLLPRIGLGQTVLVAAAINVIVFGLAALLARGFNASKSAPHGVAIQQMGASIARTPRPPGERVASFDWILPLVLVSGVVSFSWEILWTRLLTHLFGGSVFAFATMLATFLIGLALGSVVAARLASSPARAWLGFAIAQISIAGLFLAAFAAVERLPDLARELAASGEGFLVSGALISAWTLLPGAVAIGATFPFAEPEAEEALAGMLSLHQPALSRGQSFSFTAQLGESPAAAVVEGWRLSGEAWQGLRRLETQLSQIDVRHPLFVAATRLRVDSGEADLAQEALDLLEPLQAPLLQLEELFLQARAGETAGKPQITLAAIRDALPRLRRQPVRLQEMRQLLLSLHSLKVEDGTAEWRNDLLSQVDRLLL